MSEVAQYLNLLLPPLFFLSLFLLKRIYDLERRVSELYIHIKYLRELLYDGGKGTSSSSS